MLFYYFYNPNTGKKEVVRYYASNPIAEECKKKISHFSGSGDTSYKDPVIIELV